MNDLVLFAGVFLSAVAGVCVGLLSRLGWPGGILALGILLAAVGILIAARGGE